MRSEKHARRWALALLVATGLGIVASVFGCARDAHEAPKAATGKQGEAAGAHGAHGEGGAGAAVVPGATAGDIRAQIQERQLALETAIREGRLSEVHDHAFAIRDLAVAVGERAGASADRAALSRAIDDLRTIAGRLDTYGDAGNLSGTEAEFGKLNDALADLWAAAPH